MIGGFEQARARDSIVHPAGVVNSEINALDLKFHHLEFLAPLLKQEQSHPGEPSQSSALETLHSFQSSL